MNMERNSDGDVSIDGEHVANIPKDQSILSVFGTNPIMANSIFGKDGWIYVDGKRVRKWYKSIDQITIWEPILDDLPKLESRYTAISEKVDKFHSERYIPMFNKIVEVGQAHAKPTHEYTGKQYAWWVYSARKYDGDSYSIGFDWLDEEPKEKLHVDIGQAYYHLERQIHRYYGYKYKFRKVLEYAINNLLMDNLPTGNGQILKLILNSRTFWYASIRNSHDVLLWTKLAWAEDEIIEMEIM